MLSNMLRLSVALSTLFSLCSFADINTGNNDPSPEKGHALFSHYVLDEKIPEIALSSFVEHKNMVALVTKNEVINGKNTSKNMFIVQSTDTKGNISAKVRYAPEQKGKDKEYTESIETMIRTQYKLRKFVSSYDPESVRATELDNGTDRIQFRYSKYGLPQNIAYFRFMEVEVIAKEGKPLSISIVNTSPFEYENIDIEQYRQEIKFHQDRNGNSVVTEKRISASGKTKKHRKAYSVSSVITPIKYVDQQGRVEILNQEQLDIFSSHTLKEEEVKLGSVLPLMGDVVRRQGIDLPEPYGISLVYRNQNMNFGLNDISIMNQSLNSILEPGSASAQVTAETLGIRGDVYILPFLNVYALIGKLKLDGHAEGEYNGELGNTIRDKLNNRLPHLGDAFCKEVSVLCQSGNINLPLRLTYDVLSVGTTLSVGYKNLFASATAGYAITRLDGESEWGDPILTIQPMIGYNWVDYRTQFFVGMEYQLVKPYFRGEVSQIEIGGQPFSYDVGADLTEEAYMIGFNKEIGRKYMLTFLYNKGDTRDSMTLNLGYRF